MSDNNSDLPRDLRGLCGGILEDADGAYRHVQATGLLAKLEQMK